MAKRKRHWNVDSKLLVTLGLLLGLVALVGLPLYALLHADLRSARWWAGVATLVALAGIPAAFLLGRYSAAQMVAGMDMALDKVARTAGQVIDLRGQAAAAARTGTTKPSAPAPDPSQVVITHTEPPSTQPTGRILEL